MNNVPEVLLAIVKAMFVIVPLLGICIFAGWLTAVIFIAKNWNRLLARFSRIDPRQSLSDPWPPRPHRLDR